MKFVFAFISLLLTMTTASANTVRIGNGGDTVHSAPPAMISILMTAPHKLRLLTHSWMSTGNADLVLPVARFKEFEQAIIDAPLEMQDNPCLVEGKPKTAAAYSTPYRSICVSLKRLARTIDKDIPEFQTLALLGHEYLHLLGYDEADAIQFQRQIMDYLARYGIPNHNRVALRQIDSTLLQRFKDVDWNNKNDVAAFTQKANDSIKAALAPLIEQQMTRYGLLTSETNIISDILMRLSYLNLVVAANWGTGPDIKGLRTTLDTQYFTVVKDGQKASITSSGASRLFWLYLIFPIHYPEKPIPYIDPNGGKEAFASVLEETDKLIAELNQSLQDIGIEGTTIRFGEN
jgi:ssRNA-specific RNase YbeY (16S rRNA maturation enzyme)